jgi:hypothetical protein
VGKLLYGIPAVEVTIEERALAHVRAVIITKLRRNESFTLTWDLDGKGAGGRRTIWIHPAIPLQFEFDDAKSVLLNTAWLDAMMVTANTAGGMRIVPEPEPTEASPAPH